MGKTKLAAEEENFENFIMKSENAGFSNKFL